MLSTTGPAAGGAAGGAHLQRGLRPGRGLVLVRVPVRPASTPLTNASCFLPPASCCPLALLSNVGLAASSRRAQLHGSVTSHRHVNTC